MLGKVLIYIAFITSVITVITYFFNLRGKIKTAKTPRLFFHITFIAVLLASAYLLNLILSHQFQFTYVWEYSSRDLGTPLLVSTFYAGQEGSFLLWTLFGVITGVFLLTYITKYKGFEPPVMMMYSLIISFLTLMLILKSPFNYVWETFPEEASVGFTPEDGRGLNPILQNFWMVIHPPVLFLGFVGMAVPFAFAIGALLNDKFNEWIGIAMPWLLYGTGILGLGIILGGYWAYGVLGWGGYWSWDPVENSSLIPWIIGIAAVHTFISQKNTGSYKKTNIILSIIGFIFVLYSTFLTRSGVLSDASVHSFVQPGMEVYIALILFILTFLILSAVLFAVKFKKLKTITRKDETPFFSRENIMYIGAMLLIASAAIIITGTSMPIITKSTVEISFYNQMNMPIAILIMLLAGLASYLDWKKSGTEKFLKRIWLPVLLSLFGTVILFLSGADNLYFAVFIFVSLLVFFVCIERIIKLIRLKKSTFGAALGHLGLALFFLGIIGSGRYSSEESLELEKNVPVESLGYTFTYLGDEEFTDPQNTRDRKYYLNVRMEKDNKELKLKPVMYFSSYMNSVMKNPEIVSFVMKDIYLSPMEIIAAQMYDKEDEFTLKKGEEKQIGNFKFKFKTLETKGMNMSRKMQGDEFAIYTLAEVTTGKEVDSVKLKLNYYNGNPVPEPYELKQENYTLFFTRISAEEGTASFAAVDNKVQKDLADDTLITTISIKPFIGVLWAGAFIMTLGFFYSVITRVKNNK
ncbi:MAG: cytochrome c biogenesis protein CcsA [Ignavibacteria bacterium]|nr:cytochrome c biogenesis protein CcsA [Ignavibacteria bacterium]